MKEKEGAGEGEKEEIRMVSSSSQYHRLKVRAHIARDVSLTNVLRTAFLLYNTHNTTITTLHIYGILLTLVPLPCSN